MKVQSLKSFLSIMLFLVSSISFAQRGGYGPHHGGGGHHGGPISSSSMSSQASSHYTSSGTSDCLWTGSSCGHAHRQLMKEKYLVENYDVLFEEVAQGKGPHLEALFRLTKCSQNDSQQTIVELKKNYASLFRKETRQSLELTNHLLLKRLTHFAYTNENVAQCFKSTFSG